MAPIRKGDGTAVVPKGISQVRTGDGRILFDGPAIPDSGVAHFDAEDLNLNDQDTVSTWEDLSAMEMDLSATGSPTFIEDGINGNPSVFYDGVDDAHQGDAFSSAIQQPVVKFVVFESETTEVGRLLDGRDDIHAFTFSSDEEYTINAGEAFGGGSVDTNPHIGELVYDGTNSEILIDGSSIGTGDAGANALDGVTVGAIRSLDQFFYNGLIGQIWMEQDPDQETRDDVRSGLASKWGISLS